MENFVLPSMSCEDMEAAAAGRAPTPSSGEKAAPRRISDQEFKQRIAANSPAEELSPWRSPCMAGNSVDPPGEDPPEDPPEDPHGLKLDLSFVPGDEFIGYDESGNKFNLGDLELLTPRNFQKLVSLNPGLLDRLPPTFDVPTGRHSSTNQPRIVRGVGLGTPPPQPRQFEGHGLRASGSGSVKQAGAGAGSLLIPIILLTVATLS